jgi:hypothetical protein
MSEARAKNLMSPDHTLEFQGITVQQVDVGDLTVGRIVTQPGWRWSRDVRPHVGGEWCEARHVGVVVSGRFEVVMRDGTTLQFGPDDVFANVTLMGSAGSLHAYFCPSWLVSLLRPVDARGPADLA